MRISGPRPQSEPAPKNAPPWMDGAWTGLFFSLGSHSRGFYSKCVQRVLNLRFIQLGRTGQKI